MSREEIFGILLFAFFVYCIIGILVTNISWNRFQKKNYKDGDLLPHEAAIGTTIGALVFVWPILLFFGQRLWRKWTGK